MRTLAILLVAVRLCAGTPADAAVCGNHMTEPGEDCDDGGVCRGGSTAGTPCRAESDCPGPGVCIGGAHAEYPCDDDSACTPGRCVRCVPQGGDGCAANCTTETDIPVHLISGVLSNGLLVPGTSGATVYGDSLSVTVPLQGSQTLTIGKERNGTIPLVVKANLVNIPKVSVSNDMGCECLRAVEARTCGGTVFAADGSPAANCTPGYTAGDSLCPSDHPCARVHGAGNAATGIIGCQGLSNTETSFTQDNLTGNPSPPVVTLSGSGDAGTTFLFNSVAIAAVIGSCGATFCTEADPFSARGTVMTLPATTNMATAEFTNAGGTPDDTICNCSDGSSVCVPSECLGPWTVMGAPNDCGLLNTGVAPSSTLVSAFTAPAQTAAGDSVIISVFVAQAGPTNTPGGATPTPTPPPCTGDCNNDHTVTSDELLTAVGIALGSVPFSNCEAFGQSTSIGIDAILHAIASAANTCPRG